MHLLNSEGTNSEGTECFIFNIFSKKIELFCDCKAF